MFKKLLVLILCILIISFGNVFASTQTQEEKDLIQKSSDAVKSAISNRDIDKSNYDKSLEDAKKDNEANKKKLNDAYNSDIAEANAKLEENKDPTEYENTLKELESNLSKVEKASDDELVNTNKELAKEYEANQAVTEGKISEAQSSHYQSLIENGTKKQIKNGYEGQLEDASIAEKKACAGGTSANCKEAKEALEKAEKDFKEAKDAYDDSATAEGDITSRGYQINVNYISPGMGVTGGTTKENVNYLLATIIQNLMIALGSLALLIMTVGAGYIVLHNGQDELLSKGKSIFMSGVYALIVALSAYYLINIIRFILFQGS